MSLRKIALDGNDYSLHRTLDQKVFRKPKKYFKMNNVDHVRLAVARAVANRDIDGETMGEVAKRIANVNHQIHGIDVCTHGFCCDFFFDKDIWAKLPEVVLLEGARLRGIEIFPWGILDPNLFRVRVTQDFEAMAGRLGR